MADDGKKTAESAEKAYVAAAEAPSPLKEPTQAAASVGPTDEEKPAAAKPASKPAPAPSSTDPTASAKRKAKNPIPRPVSANALKQAAKTKDSSPPSGPVTRIKEFTMAKTDFSKTMTDAMSEVQTRAKEAYEKTTEMAGEASEFAKGNIEAIVESGKIFSSGMQDMSKTYIEEARNAFETLTADMKEMAAVRSPTELFQLQGKLMRRNFDSAVAFGSRNSEALVKLANESMSPISSRMSIAADKVSKATA